MFPLKEKRKEKKRGMYRNVDRKMDKTNHDCNPVGALQ